MAKVNDAIQVGIVFVFSRVFGVALDFAYRWIYRAAFLPYNSTDTYRSRLSGMASLLLTCIQLTQLLLSAIFCVFVAAQVTQEGGKTINALADVQVKSLPFISLSFLLTILEQHESLQGSRHADEGVLPFLKELYPKQTPRAPPRPST